MNHVYLLIGGNMGDRMRNLAMAREHLAERCGTMLQHSSVYETAAWGTEDQPDFLNQVVLLQTLLEPRDLLRAILDIEHGMGRFRAEKYGPRVMDIDILLYDDAIISEPGLQVPHPRMASRRFALTPLAEIAGNRTHPQTGKTIATMLEECDDPLPVDKKSP
jgi:2-amino-4-hydroxy-6-hydroxymethyldihydropteridine diphosphokinase